MPSRIRRERTRGWRRGDAVIVDRTSRFGNPFRIVDDLVVRAPDGEPWNGRQWTCSTPTAARQHAASLYAAWLDGHGPDTYTVRRRVYDRRRVLAALPELRGRDLACTCPLPEPGEPDHCHGAVLLRLANAAEGTAP